MTSRPTPYGPHGLPSAPDLVLSKLRRLLPGEEGGWIEELRRELHEVHVRALECTALRCLPLGGPEVACARSWAPPRRRRSNESTSGC